MKQVTYGIPDWSYKTFRARKNYCCRNCDGIIPSGVVYMRHVERLGPQKGKDPLRNVHIHLDCTAPWYQPEASPRLRHVGKLPGKVPPPSVYDGVSGFLTPAVYVRKDAIGTLQWQLPQNLAQKLAFAPKPGLAITAVAEIETALAIVASALLQAVGHQRKSMKLSHLINEIAAELQHTSATDDVQK